MLPDIETIRRLLEFTERTKKEVVYVKYEDGSYNIFTLDVTGGFFPVNLHLVEYIFHTHPVARYTPSLADIITAYRLSRVKGKPIPLYTACKLNNEVIIYEIAVSPYANIDEIINQMSIIENLIVSDFEKYSKIQHYKLLSRRDISITRFTIKLD